MVSCLYVVSFEVGQGHVWQRGAGSLEMIELIGRDVSEKVLRCVRSVGWKCGLCALVE